MKVNALDNDPGAVTVDRAAWEQHWFHYHTLKHIERRLMAIGREDIIQEAEEHARDRQNGTK